MATGSVRRYESASIARLWHGLTFLVALAALTLQLDLVVRGGKGAG